MCLLDYSEHNDGQQGGGSFQQPSCVKEIYHKLSAFLNKMSTISVNVQETLGDRVCGRTLKVAELIKTYSSAMQKLKASVTSQISEALLFFFFFKSQSNYEVFFLCLVLAAGRGSPGCPPTPLLSQLLLAPIGSDQSYAPIIPVC